MLKPDVRTDARYKRAPTDVSQLLFDATLIAGRKNGVPRKPANPFSVPNILKKTPTITAPNFCDIIEGIKRESWSLSLFSS